MPKQNIEAVNISAMTAEQRDAALALDVERLLRFGRKHKLIKELEARAKEEADKKAVGG